MAIDATESIRHLPNMQTTTYALAKAKNTLLYFNGTNFSAGYRKDALQLPADTTAESFRFAWDCEVVIEVIAPVTEEWTPRKRNLAYAIERIETKGEIFVHDSCGYGLLRQIPLTSKHNAGTWVTDRLDCRTANALRRRYNVQQWGGYDTPFPTPSVKVGK